MKYIPKKPDGNDRAGVLRSLLGDDILTVMTAFRQSVRAFVSWPWSRKRQRRLMEAIEDVIACQVNRIQSTTGTVADILDKRVQAVHRDVLAVTAALIDIDERVSALEPTEASSATTRGQTHGR